MRLATLCRRLIAVTLLLLACAVAAGGTPPPDATRPSGVAVSNPRAATAQVVVPTLADRIESLWNDGAGHLRPVAWPGRIEAVLIALATMGALALLMATGRDPGQFALAALVASLAAWVLLRGGVAQSLWWPARPDLTLHAVAFCASLSASSGAWFTKILLVPRAPSRPRVARTLDAALIAGAVGLVTVSMVPTVVTLAVASVAHLTSLVVAGPMLAAKWRAGEPDRHWTTATWITCAAIAAHAAARAAGLELPPPWGGGAALDLATLLAAALATVSLAAGGGRSERLRSMVRSSLIDRHAASHLAMEHTVKARTFELQMANEQLARLTRIDGLTGVFNRRHFDERLSEVARESASTGRPMAVIMIDLDHFKRLNDEYGHACGDQCLIQAGRLARDVVPADRGLVARYGGEEFVVLVGPCDRSEALQLAESIRRSIEAARPSIEGREIPMSASIGVCCRIARAAGDGTALQIEADAALYAAKHSGRNRVAESTAGAGASDLPQAREATAASLS